MSPDTAQPLDADAAMLWLSAMGIMYPHFAGDAGNVINVIAARDARIRELELALKPFADSLGEWAHEMGDTRSLWIVWGTPDRQSFSLGDLRRASALLHPKVGT